MVEREALFEWDDAKRHANLVKHGVDFAAIDAFDWESRWSSRIPGRGNHGGLRWATSAIGSTFALYSLRGMRRRVISLRRANAREVRRYAETQA